MNRLAIRAEGLSKEYRIGRKANEYKTLRESITESVTSPLNAIGRRLNRSIHGRQKELNSIWALDDVSFEVEHGDVIGIIGRNGAGKSTLLKILSRITEPTRGYADVEGRIGSLLEVGTGFHPELTGRENVFLNGAILGMTKAEIRRKFDQIVDFAAVERFLDTPIKRYSSGMHLRLAFAVAAHLEPDILLVDEVLAVGDVDFQRKCLNRMDEVAHEGRTVLFVSHNMGAVRSLCTKGIYLDQGKIQEAGDLSACIKRYFHSVGALEDQQPRKCQTSRTGFDLVSINGESGNTINQEDDFVASTVLKLPKESSGFDLFCLLYDMHGRLIFRLRTSSRELEVSEMQREEYPIRLRLPPLWLIPGLYSLQFKAESWGHHRLTHRSDKFPLDVQGTISTTTAQDPGMLHPIVDWSIDSACGLDEQGSAEDTCQPNRAKQKIAHAS